MRIIAGVYRSRQIASVPGMNVRPTSDRMRESLFSILSPVLENAIFVDAFAGTGAVGIEAISRGARKAIFLEKDKRAQAVLKDNLMTLGISRSAYEIVPGKAGENLADWEADIVFLDPPYDQEKDYIESLANAHAPLVIAQHSVRLKLPELNSKLTRYREVRQGDNMLSFYRSASTE